MVFQQFNLFNNMNVLRNLTAAPVKIKGMSPAEAEEKAVSCSPGSALQTSSLPTLPSFRAGRSSGWQ